MTNTKKSVQGRHLVLIDIENLTCNPAPSSKDVAAAIKQLREAVPGFESAQRIWACSHRAARTVGFAVLADRQLWRSGNDGADLALLEVMETERLEQRYERITVCSGDGIFADSIARLARQGVWVGVAGIRGRVSARMRLAAQRVTYLREADAALGTAS